MKDPMPEKSSYHHGDLRAALIAHGLKLLAERNADDLSLREVARGVGVSPTAVYRHFPDKVALMAALAAQGLKQLGREQHAAFEAAGGGGGGFSATGAAYVRFAISNPALFRLIFAGTHPSVDEPDDASRFLHQNAVALAPPGVDAKVFALQAWSIAHGLALLMLDGQVPIDDTIIDRVVDAHWMAPRASS